MKKLLLFTLAMGLGAMSYAQMGLISVDQIVLPNSSVTTGDPLNGTDTIKVQITNNETNFTYEKFDVGMKFTVKVDGIKIENPNVPNTTDFVILFTNDDLAPGASTMVNVVGNWAAVGDQGTHTLCVKLETMSSTKLGQTISNTDNQNESCKDLEYSWPTSISEVQPSEISSIITNENQLTVSVKNAENLSKINVMSITGQVVKTASVRNGVNEIQETFDISNLTAGVYIVTLQSENGSTQAQKIFVQ